MEIKTILGDLEEKFKQKGEPLDTYLKGLLVSKPLSYWDYIRTDTLLTLQQPRTQLPDEMVFILYHQLNEILFKMILWEMEQLATAEVVNRKMLQEKLTRISRYFDMLSSSFDIMGDGMDPAEYLVFRDALAPASGFQSFQYRMIELSSTEAHFLLGFGRKGSAEMSLEDLYEGLYWQKAGVRGSKKSVLLQSFEAKYKTRILAHIQAMKDRNLWAIFQSLPEKDRLDETLKNTMRHYDFTVNVKWTLAHYHAAEKYLDSGEETAEATGGSDWKKYMHPAHQKRIFFPDLWSKEDKDNWGKEL